MEIHSFPILIKEVYLDLYGHVNNAVYLTLFEEARWDLITKNGYGLKKIQETGLGPVMLEVKMRYLKELCVRDHIVIQSRMLSYEKKISRIEQNMVRGEEICCTAEFAFGLFNLKERKLVLPTQEWLQALGFTGQT
jgi:YbgC/YbaW family acyl-CoA thioester hydrolase